MSQLIYSLSTFQYIMKIYGKRKREKTIEIERKRIE